MEDRTVVIDGKTVMVETPGGLSESRTLDYEWEALAYATTVKYALTWIGTPFRNCADIKGPTGGVDCAMSLVRWHVDTGRVDPFDPRPYPSQWMMHRDREDFLEWIINKLGLQEVDHPLIGDLCIYKWYRCFSHGALYIGNGEVVHAFADADVCLISGTNEAILNFLPTGKPRPVRYFNVRGH